MSVKTMSRIFWLLFFVLLCFSFVCEGAVAAEVEAEAAAEREEGEEGKACNLIHNTSKTWSVLK